MASHPEVMISSTARDLPDHRREAEQACLRQKMFPIMMEHLPASDDDAIAVSLAMVDRSDFYLGILGFRFGYVPDGHKQSITEMEYRRALEKNIPVFAFLMHRKHPLLEADVETGPARKKLDKLRKELEKQRVVNYFTSPAQLGAQIIHTLSTLPSNELATLDSAYEIPDTIGAVHTSSLDAMLKPDEEDFDRQHRFDRISYEAIISKNLDYTANVTFAGANVSHEPSDHLIVPFVVLGAPGRMEDITLSAYDVRTKTKLNVSDPANSIHPRNCDKLMLRISTPEVATGEKFAVRLQVQVAGLMWSANDYDAVGLKRYQSGIGEFRYQMRSELKPVEPRCYGVQWGGGLKRLHTKFSGRRDSKGRYLIEPKVDDVSEFGLGLICHYRELQDAAR